jgi:hypothetical protein
MSLLENSCSMTLNLHDSSSTYALVFSESFDLFLKLVEIWDFKWWISFLVLLNWFFNSDSNLSWNVNCVVDELDGGLWEIMTGCYPTVDRSANEAECDEFECGAVGGLKWVSN